MSSAKHKLRLAGAFAALATLALAVSCRGFFVNPTLTSITVGPSNLSLTPGQTFQMVATGTFNDGSTATVTSKCVWDTDDHTVATFSTTVIGQIIAAQNIPNPPGTAKVTAQDGTVSNTTTITVCPSVQTLTVTPSTTTPTAGSSMTFTAKAVFTSSSTQTDVTSQVTWNISNTTVIPSIASDGSATVNSTAKGLSTTVSATLCGVTSAAVTITAQ